MSEESAYQLCANFPLRREESGCQMSHEELESVLSSAPFVQQFGFRLESAEPGKCTLHWPFNDRFLRHDGIVSGPVLMAAADTAMWIASISSLGQEALATVTVEMKTNFLSAVKRGEDFWCTAKLRKTGSRIIFGTAECLLRDGRVLSHHSMSFIRPSTKA
jgi:uncharacterized protein (TIGR00369 family)